jgi:hypothetical protein
LIEGGRAVYGGKSLVLRRACASPPHEGAFAKPGRVCTGKVAHLNAPGAFGYQRLMKGNPAGFKAVSPGYRTPYLPNQKSLPVR